MVAHRGDLIALLLAILLLASYSYPQSSLSSDSLPKESDTYPLAGKVVNSITGKPVPRVLVRLPELQRAVLTDSEGNFSFNDVPADEVAVLAFKPGYFRADQPLAPDQFYVCNNSPYEFNVGPDMGTPILRLLPEAVVFGTVRGNMGRGLAEVLVSVLVPEHGKQQAQFRTVREDVATDFDGKFFISGLAPGRYYLRVRPGQASMRILQPKTAATQETYPTEVYFPDADAAGAAPLDLAAGQAREANFNLKLIRMDKAKANPSSPLRAETEQAASANTGRFQISGVLVDDLSGRPISQGRVAISEATRPYDSFAAVATAGDGRFSFSGLAEGKYILSAARDGEGYNFYDSHDALFTTGIVLGQGLDPGNLVFRLPVYSRLSGRITDEAGEPVHKARVQLYWTGTKYGVQSTNPWYLTETNEQGAYHFDVLLPGRYFIAVMASPWYAQRPAVSQAVQTDFYSSFSHNQQTFGTYMEQQGPSPLDVAYPVMFYPGTTEASAAIPVTLSSGEHLAADLTLKPVPALHISLSPGEAGDKEQKGIFEPAQIQVRLLNASPVDVPAETRMLPSGKIDITGIAPGHYRVKVHGVLNNRVQVLESGEIDVLSSGEKILDHEKPSVPLTANVQFEGTPDPSSNPANQYLFMSDSDSRNLYSIAVPAPGTFELQGSAEPGNYQLSMNGNISHFVKSVSATGATVNGNTVKIDGNGPVNLNVTVAFGGAIVTGVALRDNKPFAGAMILLAPLAPADAVLNKSLFKQDQSDSDGSFGLGAVAPGKYVLIAVENGWDLEWTNPVALRPYLSHGVVLQVEGTGKYNVNVSVQ